MLKLTNGENQKDETRKGAGFDPPAGHRLYKCPLMGWSSLPPRPGAISIAQVGILMMPRGVKFLFREAAVSPAAWVWSICPVIPRRQVKGCLLLCLGCSFQRILESGDLGRIVKKIYQLRQEGLSSESYDDGAYQSHENASGICGGGS